MNTPAVILRHEALRGADVRVIAMTEQLGKIEATARGLKKGGSKLAAHVEPLMATELFLVRGHERWLVAGSVVERRHERIRGDLTRLYVAGLLVRIVDLMVPLDSHDAAAHLLLADALALLDAEVLAAETRQLLPSVVAWKLIVASGYQPDLQCCVTCNRRGGEGTMVFDARNGVLHHRACVRGEVIGQALSITAVKGLQYVAAAPLSHVPRLRAVAGVFTEMQRAVKTVAEERLGVGASSRFWVAAVEREAVRSA